MTAKTKPEKYGPHDVYVRWNELSEYAKHQYATNGAPSNRPTLAAMQDKTPRFKVSGRAWIGFWL